MAEKYDFVMGTLHNDFLQLKTTDNIYLKDLLEQEIFPSLALYNERVTAVTKLLVYNYDDAVANSKQMFSEDSFSKLSDIEQPDNKTAFESWNRPIPIARYGAGTKLTLETLLQMTSKAVLEWHNAKMIADSNNLIKLLFQFMALKTPSSAIDELTHIAATPKAFWNDEASMDTPRANGQITFDGDHQHFLAVAAANNIGTAGSELTTLLGKLTEHEGMDGQPLLWVRKGASPSTLIQAESTNFRSVNKVSALFSDPNSGYGTTGLVQSLISGSVSLGHDVDIIGTWKNAVVIETPHLPAGYVLATMYSGENSTKQPLGWRSHPSFKGLLLYSDSNSNPIIGKDAQYRRYLGLGVWDRSAGALLKTDGTSWTEPSFT